MSYVTAVNAVLTDPDNVMYLMIMTLICFICKRLCATIKFMLNSDCVSLLHITLNNFKTNKDGEDAVNIFKYKRPTEGAE